MKRSCGNINKKNIRNTKIVYLHEESLVLLLNSPLCYVVLHCNLKTILCDVEEATCTTNSFVALPRLHATAVDCAHELVNGESEIKGEACKILQN